MDGATEVLIIILSVTLTVFLLLGITLAVILIKLSKALQRIATKAEDVIDNVESAAASFSGVAGKLATGKFLANIVELVMKKRKGKG